MLEYLYCNSVNINQDLAKDLVRLAQRYAIVGLKVLCEEFLCEGLATENLVAVANLAEEVKSNVLQKVVVKLMRTHVTEFNAREDLLEIPKSILFRCLFKSDEK